MATPIYTPVTLSGSSASSGAAGFALLLLTPISLSGASASSGTATLTSSILYGAFDDFALIPYVAGAEITDPQVSSITNTTPRIAPGDTVNAWQRISITATAPTAYSPGLAGLLYNRAAYARLSINTDAMPVSSTQYFTYLQMEQTPGGSNVDTDLPSINLLTLNQSSYEGPLYYQPDQTDGSAVFARSSEQASCGRYSGKYTYNTIPLTNTYTNLQLWGTYANAAAQRDTYASLNYSPPPGAPVSPGGGTNIFTLVPTPDAMVTVQPSTFVVGSVAIASDLAGRSINCRIIQYNAAGTIIATSDGTAVTSLGGYQWQTITVTTTLLSTTVHAAVVPRVNTGAAVNTVTWYVDEHRLYIPSNRNQSAVGTSPARPWQPPRQTIITPRATRVNYCQNPGFQNDTTGWNTQTPSGSTSTWTRALTAGLNGGPAGDFTLGVVPAADFTGTGTGTSTWTGVYTYDTFTGGSFVAIGKMPASTVCTFSAYVRAVQGPVPLTIWAYDGTSNVRGTSTPITTPTGATPYVRLSVTVTTSETFGGAVRLHIGYGADGFVTLFQDVVPGTNPAIWQSTGTTGTGSRGTWTAGTTYSAADTVNDAAGNLYTALVQNGPWANVGPFEFYVDDILAEVSGQVGAYFDGNSPSPDYLWEGTAGESRSHYYRGKTVNQYRLDRAIQRSLPLGASYRIVYAVPPS